MMTEHAAAGPVRAVIVDLAGTVVDFGSRAPAGAFVEAFAKRGVTVSLEAARGPMGMAKRDHIRALLETPGVAEAWAAATGAAWTESDVDALYEAFIPLQLESLPRYADLAPGAAEAVAAFREAGLKVAATTGYNREMTEVVLRAARERGLDLEVSVCATDVPAGRPAPWMLFRAMEALDVYPPAAVVAIGDTIPDIEAALNAGARAVGVAMSGNMIGLSESELAALPPEERAARRDQAYEALRRAGAHRVVDGIADAVDAILAWRWK